MKRKFFKKKNIEIESRAADFEKAAARLKSACPYLKGTRLLDYAFFDLDSENRFCDGLIAITENVLVTIIGDENGAKIREISVDNIESISVRSEFGVYIAELLTKGGETVILCNSTMNTAKRATAFFKRAELYLTDKTVYERKKEELPLKCSKCGRMLPKGSKSCPRCAKKGKTLKRLAEIALPHKTTLVLVTFIYLAALGITMIEPYLNRIMVDNYINNAEASALALSEPFKVLLPFLLTVFMVFAAYMISWIVCMVRNIIMIKMGLSIVVDLRTRIFDKVQQMSLESVSRRTSGEIMKRVSDDTMQIQNFMNHWVPNFIAQALLLVSVCIIMCLYDPILLLIFIAPMPITMCAIYFFNRKIRKIYGKQWEASSRSTAALHDIFSGIRVVKAFGTEEKEGNRYADAVTKEHDLGIKNELLFAKLQPFIRIGILFANFLLLYYTGSKILGNELTIGEASMLSTYATMVYGPINVLASFPSMFVRTLTSANRIFEIIDEDVEIANIENPVEKEIDGFVSFENVSFGYDDTQRVLKNINLEIKPGEMIGLVGRSGVGKSTLINLMMRLYDVESGSVKIDGIDIKDYSQECLRSQIGVVLQETILFSGSLYDNVSYAKPGATKKEVLEASRAAGVHDFAIKLPDGYNTKIGEKGYTLSGGERQRVAIARAILRNPRILILDEATASLDTEIEKQIQEAIEVLIKERTTIAIAHRLSTLRNATKIVVLDKGTVAEAGTHSELLRQKGLYYELVMAQRQNVIKT